MQPLMPSVDTPDRLFHDGDPTQGVEGTIVDAQYMNNHQGATQDIQRELIAVLAAAAMEPDPAKQDQLVEAIRAIVGSGTADKANSADKLTTPRNIAGHPFDGTADISISAADVGALPSDGKASSASSADKLSTARKIANHPFDGTADISISASDVGAVSKSGDTMSGVLKVNAEIQTTAWDSYRMVVGNYGTFWRQDGNTLYLMLTNAGNQYGSYNDFRPLIVDLKTGIVTLPHGSSVNGLLYANEVNAGGARFTNDGNLYGSMWGGDWLSNYINSRLAKSPNAAGVGGVGTYAFCSYKYAYIAPNQLVSGSDLFISGVGAQKSSSGWGDKSLVIDQAGTLSGTWMCCGAQPGPYGNDIGATLYYRIA